MLPKSVSTNCRLDGIGMYCIDAQLSVHPMYVRRDTISSPLITLVDDRAPRRNDESRRQSR